MNMKKGNVEKWFPKTVYVADDILLDYLPIMEQHIKRVASKVSANRTDMQQVDSLHIVNDTLHKDPEFQPFVQCVMFHAFTYLTELGYSETQINGMRLSNMWANISHENDYVTPHHHSGSLISGAFYIKALPDSKIRFYNTPDMAMRPNTYNELNYQYCQYACTPGRLVLFKSDLVHGTDRQGAGEKIVVSFNIVT